MVANRSMTLERYCKILCLSGVASFLCVFGAALSSWDVSQREQSELAASHLKEKMPFLRGACDGHTHSAEEPNQGRRLDSSDFTPTRKTVS